MYGEIGDHPDIANALRYGYPDPDTTFPTCPECGEECTELYEGRWETVGCECCCNWVDAWADENQPLCPECGKECESYCVRKGGIVGCENCVQTKDAWEALTEAELNFD